MTERSILNNQTKLLDITLMIEEEIRFNSFKEHSPSFPQVLPDWTDILKEKDIISPDLSAPTDTMQEVNLDISFEAVTTGRQSEPMMNFKDKPSFSFSSLNQNTFSFKQINNQASLTAQKRETQFKISQVLTDDRRKGFKQLDLRVPNVYESEVLVLSKYNCFQKRIMNLFGSLRIDEKLLYLKDLHKISIEPETVKGKAFKMVIHHKSDKYTLGVQLKRQLYLLPEHFIWLAKIINSVMMVKGHHLSSTVEKPLSWNSTFCQGEIFKQSKYLKKWNKRFVVITPQGLYSYRTLEDQHPSIFVPVRSIKELSTSFDTYHQNLIIRLTFNDEKVEFGIPVQDYCLKAENNWLLAFYRLLMEFKYHIKIA